jgi:hypothetical protein
VQRPLTSGPRGLPAGQTPWPASPTLQPLMGWLHGDILQEAVEGNPKLKVGGGRTPWTPINTPLPMEIKAKQHSFCSSPLIKVRD